MKSKYFENGISRFFIFLYILMILSTCTIIKGIQFKTMILNKNSKSYLSSREKMNKIVEKYKSEISKYFIQYLF